MSAFLKKENGSKGRGAEEKTAEGLSNFIIKFFIIDSKVLFSKEFVWLFGSLLSLFALSIYAASAFFIASGQEVVSESSVWSGIRHVEQGFFIDPASAGPSIAATEIGLKQKTNYVIKIEVSCKPWMMYNVDFHGAGYDSTNQEKQISCNDKKQQYIINSDTPPERASLRIFFTSANEGIKIDSVRVYELSLSQLIVRNIMLLCAVITLPSIALYQKNYRLFTALSLGIIALATYTSFSISPRIGNFSDNRWYIPTALSILHDGDINLSEYADLIKAYQNYGIVASDQFGLVNIFPVGVSIVALPFTFIGEIFNVSSFDIAVVAANAIAALSVVVLFALAGNLGCSVPKSLFIAGLFAFGTSHLSIHAGGLWSHNVIVLISLLAFYIVTERTGQWMLALPFVLFLGYLSRPDFSLIILAVIGYLALEEKERAIQVAAILTILMSGFFIWSYLGYGDILPPYYRSSRLSLDGFGEHLIGQMFSPNRGLFIFNPIFLLSIWGGVIAFRRNIDFKLLYRLIMVVCLLFFAVVACFAHWWGGYSFGPRLHAPVLGLLSILLIPSLNELPRSLLARRILIAFIVLATVWGVYVHGRAAIRMSVHNWNNAPVSVDEHPERVWSWKDMQIFR
jgi:hypothetical protein